jgi:hypothetical protein
MAHLIGKLLYFKTEQGVVSGYLRAYYIHNNNTYCIIKANDLTLHLLALNITEI